MKFFSLFPLLTVLVSTSGFAATDFKPLLGSQWAQEHPGLLPYSQCSLGHLEVSGLPYPHSKGWDQLRQPTFDKNGLWTNPPVLKSGIQGGLIIGGSVVVGSGSSHKPYLACVSTHLKLAYVIPIEVSNITTVGEIGILSYDLPIEFSKSLLNGKTVEELYGSYGGPEAGIGWGGSCRFAKFYHDTPHGQVTARLKATPKNDNGPAPLPNCALGYSSFSLSPAEIVDRTKRDLTYLDFENPYILTADSTAIDVQPETEMTSSENGYFAWIEQPDGNFVTVPRGVHDRARVYTRKDPQGKFEATPYLLDHGYITGLRGTLFTHFSGESDILIGHNQNNVTYHNGGRAVSFRREVAPADPEKLSQLKFVHESKFLKRVAPRK